MAKRTPPKKTGKTYRVRIQAADREQMRALPLAQMDTGCTGGIRDLPEGGVALEAFVSEELVEQIRKLKAKVEVLGDAEEELKRAQKQVGRGNRFKGENWIPRGVGKKIRPTEVKQ